MMGADSRASSLSVPGESTYLDEFSHCLWEPVWMLKCNTVQVLFGSLPC